MENLYDVCVQNFFINLTVKEFCKSVYTCRSYDQKSSVLFFKILSVVCVRIKVVVVRYKLLGIQCC